MEWKRPLVSFGFAGATASMFLWAEGRLMPPGHVGWFFVALLCLGFVVWLHRDDLLGRAKGEQEDPSVGVARAILRAPDVDAARRIYDGYAESAPQRQTSGRLPFDAMMHVYERAGMRREADDLDRFRAVQSAFLLDDLRAGRPIG